MFRWAEILIDTSLWIFVARRFVNAAAKFLPHSGNFVWNQIEHAAFLRLRGCVGRRGQFHQDIQEIRVLGGAL
ncbi:hypothetical protein NKI25_04005 [Mesorhizobium sp. M0808]|uniref:hypothetical protein n=1 Tax=Mesorhizobium sp. M0808 TaxID=2957002 RepID=UPI0033388DA3